MLLILAVIAIREVTGDGIIWHAKEAKEKNAQTTLEEEIRLKLGEKRIEDAVGTNSKKLEAYLKEIAGVEVIAKSSGNICIVSRENAVVTVDNSGEIVGGTVDFWDGNTQAVPEIKKENETFNWYIYTGEQMKFFEEFVNNANTLTEVQKTLVTASKYKEEEIQITENTTVYLMNHLDLGAEGDENGIKQGTEWKTIGRTQMFIGTFDGQNHYISGVYINNSENFTGLFGKTNTIKNLTIRDSFICGGNCMGGIIGISAKNVTIENCHNKNTTCVSKDGEYYCIGGIVGQASEGTIVTNCTNSGLITGNGINSKEETYAGGIAGCATMVTNCNNSGAVTGRGKYVGGITGYNFSTISECSNSGAVKGCKYVRRYCGSGYQRI